MSDPTIDVVYIATPHNAHYPCAALALAGRQAHAGGEAAGAECHPGVGVGRARDGQGVVLVEALWTMFLPKFDVIRQLLEYGVLGEVRTVMADHGEYFADGHRILRRDLAGGPLLDLGTYPVSFAGWVLGEPVTVHAAGRPHPAGVNGQVSARFSPMTTATRPC